MGEPLGDRLGYLWGVEREASEREMELYLERKRCRRSPPLPSSWLGEVRVVKESSCPSVMDAGAGADGEGKMRVEEG